jgi:hypothetical protein
MVSWVLIAVVVLFPLAQVPLVIYIGKYVKLREGETPGRSPAQEFWEDEGDAPADAWGRSGAPPREGDPDATGEGGARAAPPALPPETVACPECGADNDRGFRYCGDCAASLSAAD